MRIIDLLQENKIPRHEVEEIFIKVAQDYYPMMSHASWSKHHIITYILYIDLPDEDIKNIIIRAARYSKLWIFS